MNDERLIAMIKRILKNYVSISPNVFSLDDYNRFEKDIWALKEIYNLKSSPFKLLPDPAKDADFEMMNATNDGLTEPNLNAKRKYLTMMNASYNKFLNIYKKD